MRSFLAMLGILILGPVHAADRPNVLVLLIDDIRWDSLGCFGNPVVVTPHIDRIADEGVRFPQARVTTSICMVSRATLLTGQHLARHGIGSFGSSLSPVAFSQSYAGILHNAGYWTGYVGKYGVGKPPKNGYDFARLYEGRHWITTPDGEKVHVTEQNARDALEFLTSRPKNKPFGLCVGFFCPHAEDRDPEQYLPQEWSAKAYAGKTIPVPSTAADEYLHALPPFLAADANEGRIRWRKRFDTPAKFQSFMTNYYRLITEVDAAIGRIIAELKKHGEYERTLIVVTGDNGYFHADRGLADKWYPYEQALRVPLIVRHPSLPPAMRGRQSDALVLNLDVAPTIVTAVGAPIPGAMQGRDLSPLFLSSTPPVWRTEYYYQHPTITNKDRIPQSEAVVSLAVKYVRWPEFDHEQLFDLRDDPTELRNLVSDAVSAKLLAEMRTKLAALRKDAQ